MNLLTENWGIPAKVRYNCPVCGVETKKAAGSDPLVRLGQVCRHHKNRQRNSERKKLHGP